MDVLSDVVAAARTGRPHSARDARSAPFGRWFPASRAAGFHVVLDGTCWLLPPGAEPIALDTGDVVFLPHGSAHGLADAPTTPVREVPAPDAGIRHGAGDGDPTVVLLCGAYLLDRADLHPLLGELPEIVHLPARNGRHPELRAAVGLLATELRHPPRPGADAALPALLDLLLLYILRSWLDARHSCDDTPTGWDAALRDPSIAAALRAVHADPARPWTVEELGRQARLSRAAFARRFTRLTGRPPLAYVTWWRLTTAARLLRTGDAPVASIAQRVGYSSPYAFTHAFKRQYGTPPGAYRSRPGRGGTQES
ncbi:AraC family transcriptional regulator [Streptomyces sp. RFCAC02]|uniref:AraC family transcriptional regulator n=1 Tax=Streptomyces sp. RFCAC02 TaxID=2499143 RepID=UPI00101FFF98|nr:AraC family transcriptional regulator [Streptomyces sp. RFCAC02]